MLCRTALGNAPEQRSTGMLRLGWSELMAYLPGSCHLLTSAFLSVLSPLASNKSPGESPPQPSFVFNAEDPALQSYSPGWDQYPHPCPSGAAVQGTDLYI